MRTQFTAEGNLTREPELRYTNSGIAVAECGLAVNRTVQRNGGEERITDFFDFSAWRDLGEHVAASLHKGDHVIVVGTIEYRTWETESGEKRSKHQVTATSIGASLRFANVQVRKIARDEPATVGAPQSVVDDGLGEEPF